MDMGMDRGVLLDRMKGGLGRGRFKILMRYVMRLC